MARYIDGRKISDEEWERVKDQFHDKEVRVVPEPKKEIPLHTWNEYWGADKMHKQMIAQFKAGGLSNDDTAEMMKLGVRIEMFEKEHKKYKHPHDNGKKV